MLTLNNGAHLRIYSINLCKIVNISSRYDIYSVLRPAKLEKVSSYRWGGISKESLLQKLCHYKHKLSFASTINKINNILYVNAYDDTIEYEGFQLFHNCVSTRIMDERKVSYLYQYYLEYYGKDHVTRHCNEKIFDNTFYYIEDVSYNSVWDHMLDYHSWIRNDAASRVKLPISYFMPDC